MYIPSLSRHDRPQALDFGSPCSAEARQGAVRRSRPCPQTWDQDFPGAHNDGTGSSDLSSRRRLAGLGVSEVQGFDAEDSEFKFKFYGWVWLVG